MVTQAVMVAGGTVALAGVLVWAGRQWRVMRAQQARLRALAPSPEQIAAWRLRQDGAHVAVELVSECDEAVTGAVYHCRHYATRDGDAALHKTLPLPLLPEDATMARSASSTRGLRAISEDSAPMRAMRTYGYRLDRSIGRTERARETRRVCQ